MNNKKPEIHWGMIGTESNEAFIDEEHRPFLYSALVLIYRDENFEIQTYKWNVDEGLVKWLKEKFRN